MRQVINYTPDDDNLDLVDIESLKALRAEALERKALDKLREEIQPTEDGELEAATELTLREQAKLDRAKLASPMLEFDCIETFRDYMERAPLPDGHLYHEANGEDLED